ncbi:MAG: histidine kinase [Nitratireductor sp.]|nr:histidine kinase [Nitratireductor sp.]
MIRTLSARLFFLTALWAIIATAAVAWFLTTSYRKDAEENLRARLTANLYNIMGSVTPGKEGGLSGAPDLRDSRFLRPASGYYWSVSALGGPGSLRSQSLSGGAIPMPEGANFNASFQREFVATDDLGQALIGIEARAFLGEGNELYTFAITANRQEVDEQVALFVRQLLIVLSLFALGFILVAFFLVRIGLAPLKRATRKLGDIREGRAERITGGFPLEIQPLIDETNALIDSNRNVIERARTQVGNLAHSLKTPLAVLRNEAGEAGPGLRSVIEQQVQLMQGQIQSYLERAMIAARAGTVTSRTEIRPALERLVRVMKKLNPELAFDLELDTPILAFAGEQQDFEEMAGNLLENAAKFAKSRISISAKVDGGRLLVAIADDGPGMTEEEIARAVRRGQRIDETKPGSGLGLSIVRDITAEYNGALSFARSPPGGLVAKLDLPAA